MLATIMIVGMLKRSLSSLTKRLWVFFALKIAAPCTTCDAGSAFDI